MTVGDIMTREVVTARRDMSIHEAARLMVEHGVSGLPVVDDEGRLIGIVSDGDLVLRPRPRVGRPWWHRFFDSGEELARSFQRAFGVTVGAVMSAPVVHVRPDLAVSLAAVLLHRRDVRRLPVVDGAGKVVGIVSRADLVRALAAQQGAGQGVWSDLLLVQALRAHLTRDHPTSAPHLEIGVRDGVVILRGPASSGAERAAIEAMARTLSGVRGVDSRLTVASAPGSGPGAESRQRSPSGSRPRGRPRASRGNP